MGIFHDKKAFASIIIASVSAIVLGAIMIMVGLVTTVTVDNSVSDTLTPAAAVGTLSFTGNITNGEYFNISSGNYLYTFEFNTTAGSTIACVAVNCIPVNLTGPDAQKRTFNDSWTASGNLTAAINANASTSALVTAANTTNLTTLTYYTTGNEGNRLGLSDTSANITLGVMAGGTEGSAAYSNVKSNINTAFILLGVLMIVGGAGGLTAVLFGWMKSTGHGR